MVSSSAPWVAVLVACATLAGCACATPSSDRDAGTDATTPDASVPDARAVDAAADAAIDAAIDSAPPCLPSPEICNGRDDDCNGVVDDEPATSAWCGATCGLDPCPSARPVAPLSSTLLTTARPTFHWALVGGADEARVEVCRDRACSDVIATFSGVTSAASPGDLPRGVVFWRLVPRLAGVDLPAVSVPWIARVPNVSHAVDGSTGTVLDVDADGRADVLLLRALPPADREVILYGESPAGVVARARVVWDIFALEATSDVDGDGRADALVIERSGCTVRDGAWDLLRPGRAQPESIRTSPGVAAGDVDGDGYADFFVPSYPPDPSHVARGGPNGIEPTLIETPSPPYAESRYGSQAFAVGDLDGDGIGDLVAVQPCDHGAFSPAPYCATDRALWRIRGGAGGLTAPERWTGAALAGAFYGGELDTGMPILPTGDLDGDGLVDLVVPELSDRAVTIAEPDGGERLSPLVLLQRDAVPDVDAWTALDASRNVVWLGPACDLDGDGFGDLVLTDVTSASAPPNLTFLRRGGPDGLRPERIALSELTGRASRCLGDDDGDGFSEIAVLLYDPAARPPTTMLHVYRGAPGGIDPTPVQVIELAGRAWF